jgi:hypothetical protein
MRKLYEFGCYFSFTFILTNLDIIKCILLFLSHRVVGKYSNRHQTYSAVNRKVGCRKGRGNTLPPLFPVLTFNKRRR